jgi:hypothetical protein
MHDWPPRGGEEQRRELRSNSYPILWQLVKIGWIGTGTASTQPSMHMTTKYAMTQHDPPPSHASDQPNNQDCCMFSALPHSDWKGFVGWMERQGMLTFPPLYLIISSWDEKMKKVIALLPSRSHLPIWFTTMCVPLSGRGILSSARYYSTFISYKLQGQT